jgi:hypothetical protein
MFKWLTRRLKPGSGSGLPKSYRRLLVLVRGDEGMADRLIDYELKRAPELSRDQAARRAIDRLEYERTR